MPRVTAHRIHFFDWIDCSLRKFGEGRSLANWQVKRSARVTWILISANEHATKFGNYPVAYQIRKYGEVITEGWIDRTIPERPILRPESLPVH